MEVDNQGALKPAIKVQKRDHEIAKKAINELEFNIIGC